MSTIHTAQSDGRPAIRGAFQHGVASGDPLSNAVILWTKVSPANDNDIVKVNYTVASDSHFTNIVTTGTVNTSKDIDHTVKVDVNTLQPSTTYWYQFKSLGHVSPTGQTRTLPSSNTLEDNITMAFVSCAAIWHGYFHAYRRISEQPDIQYVVHLGDYIYEYELDGYPPPGGHHLPNNRDPQPPKTIITLSDYRTRYAQYHQDPDLQELHRLKPFISVWDDHEFADNAWWGGAPSHDPKDDGPWSDRRFAAARAWHEYIPVRQAVANPLTGDPNSQTNPAYLIYRKFQIGKLIDLIMLDTRMVGRDEQGSDDADERPLLGDNQRKWLYESLTNSTALYRVIGNQVMIAPKPARIGPIEPNLIADDWNGYPGERTRLIEHIHQNNQTNVIMFTGDLHASVASNILLPDTDKDIAQNRVFVEFVGPSVTSATPVSDNPILARVVTPMFYDFNPGLQGINLIKHGFMRANFSSQHLLVDYVYIESTQDPDKGAAQTNMTWIVRRNDPQILPLSI